ncbi:NFACT RNA binding domain-containing protein [Lacticaseibacillus nasuensis]|uniref:NFACT RNA binding domain-containing protein n=1 Tax=Lacticaseibacillus nasuensis TaxID=944671 RepID=UPI002246881B|nr:NFACT RNA binding domain-containing protein [Lacticaseibacillus nasuensis]MCX2454888.1 NFACT family protein [Lacticaseibacillus nasuensis]
MTYDGFFTHAMVAELQPLVGGRVSKIQQPYQNEVVLTIRANRKNQPLLLSAHPQYARVQITRIPFANPEVPTNFAMTLRKYLAGAGLVALTQAANDRVIWLDFSTRDELGDDLSLRLIVEMMGRHSNITLLNQTTNRIIDLIRHVGNDQNRYRLLLPGATYVEPPKQDKVDPFTDDATDYLELVRSASPDVPLTSLLQRHYQGLAADTAAELAARLSTGDPGAAWAHFLAGFDAPQPTIATGQKVNFSAIPYRTLAGETQTFATLSEMLDAFYAQKAEHDRVQQLGGNLIHTLRLHIERDQKKQKKLAATLRQSAKAQDYRVRGEVLTTYLSQVQRGMTSVTLPNYYADNAPLTIALSNQLTPSQNAQKYFTKYQKLRNSVSFVTEQMAQNQAELDYLQGVMAQIELASPKDLADIRLELTEGGYLKAKRQGKKPAKRQKVAAPEQFYASDGTIIWVGKNNLQNDALTLHKAKKTDIWLHAKDIPGSHVIIDSADPSEQTLLEAANLAAFFSKSRASANVQVDWIEVRKIRKPNGAKPGFVVYEGQRTVAVTPDAALVAKLRQPPTR